MVHDLRTRALGAALPALGAAAATLRNLLVPEVVGRVPDDAFFYLVIARNLAAGRGFTFDGEGATTGFHPLWLALARLLPLTTPAGGLQGLLVLHGVVAALDAVALAWVLRRAGARPRWAAGLGVAAGAWGASAYGLGMETGLVALAGLWAMGLGLGQGSRLPAFLVGLLAGLTRIDALPVLFGAGLRTPAALAGGLSGVAITLVSNRWMAGEWLSTAAALKGLGTVGERLARLEPAAVWRHVPGPSVVALLVLLGVALLRRPPRTVTIGVTMAALGLCAEYLLNNLVGPWYHLPLAWLLVAAAGRSRLGAVLVGLALLRAVPLPARTLHGTVRDFAAQVVGSTPAGSRLVAEDFPGMLAWFGERDVLPADGLAAEPGYRAALVAGEGIRWWEARGATHWVVTRRRAPWLAARPLVDRLAPPFLPVPAATIALDERRLVGHAVDPTSDRLFAVFTLE